jgi:glycosyltransferase involved in cell wall biosynthesis
MESPVLDIRMLHHTGIGVYLQGLLEGMARLEDAPRFLFYGPHEFRPQVPERLCELFVLTKNQVYSLKEQFFFPERLRFQSLFHAPHYNIPLRFRGKLVVTIHDLNHLLFPEYLASPLKKLYARYMFGEVAVRAAHVIVVSEHIQNEVQEHLKIEPERITVIHEAVSDSFGSQKDPEKVKAFHKEHGLPDQYLLAVGINKPHKNLPFVLNCMGDLWKSKQLDIPLVIAGLDDEGLNQLKALAAEKGLDSLVHLMGRFSRTEAPCLYSGAAALVFPSLYEGFGLPPLEAMKMDVPVLASCRPPMKEIAGNAALFFDPESADEFRDAILRIVSDSDLRLDLAKKGRSNLERFSWTKTARQTLDIYRKVAGELNS